MLTMTVKRISETNFLRFFTVTEFLNYFKFETGNKICYCNIYIMGKLVQRKRKSFWLHRIGIHW